MNADDAHVLTLYFFPSPMGINWDSPAKLLKSAIINHLSFKNRKIGHVAIGLKKPGQDRDEFLTGMTDTAKPYTGMLLREKVGFAVLWTSIPGRLETRQELWAEILEKRGSGRLSVLKIKISESTYDRLVQYLTEYSDRNYQVNYGLYNRPRHGEGAGCSAFAASFLEVAGLDFDEFKSNWSFNLNFPGEYIGRPLFDREVPLTKLLSMPTEWAADSSEHKKLFFWDPDSMHRWALSVDPATSDLKLKVGKYSTCRLLEMDCRDVPTPTEPIWQGEAANYGE